MIRIGIVGCGRILAAHLRGYVLLRAAGVDDVRITALCARKTDDAQMYVQRGQGPPQRPAVSDTKGDPLAVSDVYLSDFQDDVDVRIFSDYREMISAGPIDAVNDFTTHALHHQVAEAALGAGKHLLTQKPLAISVAAGRRMCELAEAKDLTLGVFENARNRPQTRHLHWLLESGRCGALQMILMTSIGNWWAPDKIVAETPWRHRACEGGGISLDIGVHLLHQFAYLAGEIKSLFARASVVEPVRYTRDATGRVIDRVDCDADDLCVAQFETDGGVTGNLCAGWCGHGQPMLAGAGAVFYTSQGSVTGDEVSRDDGGIESVGELYRRHCDPKQQQSHFPLGLEDQFALNQHDWLAAIRDRRPPETSGRVGLRDLAAAYAILESSLAGRRVAVDEVLAGDLRDFQRRVDERFGVS